MALLTFLEQLFPQKPRDSILRWYEVLMAEEFDSVESLSRASPQAWTELRLPLAIKDQIRTELTTNLPAWQQPNQPSPNPNPTPTPMPIPTGPTPTPEVPAPTPQPSRTSARRILADFQHLHTARPPGFVTARLESEEDVLRWLVALEGPPNTPYEGGLFWVEITYPPTYPFARPNLKFVTPIFHPQINEQGQFCNHAKDDWSPRIDTADLLAELMQMLDNSYEPSLHPRCGVPGRIELWQNNREEYRAQVRAHTARFASG